MYAMPNKIIQVSPCPTPGGTLILGSFDGKLCLCDWQVEAHRACIDRRLKRMLNAEIEEGTSPLIKTAMAQLDEFFASNRKAFDVPLLFAGTDFQKTVWAEILKIPYGTTISYGELAHRVGRPSSIRAVANATGANSISIFAPCHRVVGSDNSLTGYGGGLEAKRLLLNLEGLNI